MSGWQRIGLRDLRAALDGKSYFFTADTMRFFRSRVVAGWRRGDIAFVVTTELTSFPPAPMAFNVRRVDLDAGKVTHVGHKGVARDRAFKVMQDAKKSHLKEASA